MSNRKKLFCWVIMISALLLSSSTSWADDIVDLRQTGIARISFLEGSASLQHAAADRWDSALVNLPIITGDLIYTGSNARVELQLHGAFIRLNERTLLEAVDLSPQHYRFDLTAGTATASLEEGLVNEVEIATPQVSIMLKKAGVYRVNVLANGDTEVIVQKGEAELLGLEAQFNLRDGRRAIFHADSPLDIEFSREIIADSWDRWNEERDMLAQVNNNSYPYVEHVAYGASDLNLYGSWSNVPNCGWVWRPTIVSAGWAPYREGRWVYYQPWGWTWVSSEPWGWLPYHYGNWVYLPEYGGWTWMPYGVNWYWSPALVSWYYVNWNNANYICWQPRPVNWQPTGQPAPQSNPPIAPGKPGQPIKHGRNYGTAGPPKVVLGTPLGVRPGLESGATALSEAEFLHGSSPRVPAHELIDRLENTPSIEPGAIPIKPVRDGQTVGGKIPRQLPPTEIVSRPVIARNVSNSPQQLGVQPRREYKVHGAPRVILNPDAAEMNSVKHGQNSAPTVVSPPGAVQGVGNPRQGQTAIVVGFTGAVLSAGKPPAATSNRSTEQKPHQNSKPAPSHSSGHGVTAPHFGGGGVGRSGRH